MTKRFSFWMTGLLVTLAVADLGAADPPKKVDRNQVSSNNGSATFNRTPTLPRRTVTPPTNTKKPDVTARSLSNQNLNSGSNLNSLNRNSLDWSYPRGFTPRKGGFDNKDNTQVKDFTRERPKGNTNPNNFNISGQTHGHTNVQPFIEVNPSFHGSSHQDWAHRVDSHTRDFHHDSSGFTGRLDRHWNANDRQLLAHDVRSRMRPQSYFRPDWRPYQHHWHGDDRWRHYWTWNGWRPYYWWRRPTWSFFTGWYGPSWGTYRPYDYGDTIIYQNNYVYMNGQQIASAQAYAQQAMALADVEVPAPPQPVDNGDPIGQWQPLGAFALVNNPNDDPNTFLQIAVSKEGFIAGTYYNRNSEELLPIQGSIDRRTQRAAWRVGEDKATVMEAGIYNLTQDQAPLLIHFGPDRTENYLLVRMEQPKQGDNSAAPSFLDESR